MQEMNLFNFFSDVNTRDVLQYLPDAVFVIDEKSGNILWANERAAVIFETSVRNLKDTNFNDIVVKGLELAEQSSYKDVAVIGGAVIGEREFFVELSANLLDSQYFITIRDVTEMTNILTQAEKTGRLNKDKNLMLTKLASEFKSPMQSILGFSQALSDGLGGDINDKQRKYVKIINKNANELLYFMNKFFEFAKVESKLFDINMRVFDIVELIQNVINDNEVSIASKKLNINIESENIADKFIFSDENVLKIVLQNIFEISMKLTDIGNISFELYNPSIIDVRNMGINLIKNATDTSYLQIRIIDNGVGIQENEIDGIFEPYTQLDKPNKKNLVRSISLGSVKELVKTLHGAVWLETEVMKGTVFNVVIPIEKGAIQQDE